MSPPLSTLSPFITSVQLVARMGRVPCTDRILESHSLELNRASHCLTIHAAMLEGPAIECKIVVEAG